MFKRCCSSSSKPFWARCAGRELFLQRKRAQSQPLAPSPPSALSPAAAGTQTPWTLPDVPAAAAAARRSPRRALRSLTRCPPPLRLPEPRHRHDVKDESWAGHGDSGGAGGDGPATARTGLGPAAPAPLGSSTARAVPCGSSSERECELHLKELRASRMLCRALSLCRSTHRYPRMSCTDQSMHRCLNWLIKAGFAKSSLETPERSAGIPPLALITPVIWPSVTEASAESKNHSFRMKGELNAVRVQPMWTLRAAMLNKDAEFWNTSQNLGRNCHNLRNQTTAMRLERRVLPANPGLEVLTTTEYPPHTTGMQYYLWSPKHRGYSLSSGFLF